MAACLPVLQLVEQSAKQFVCIVDESKLVSGLGGSKGGRPCAGTAGVQQKLMVTAGSVY